MDETVNSKPRIRNRYVLLGDLILIPVIVIGSFAIRLELGSTFIYYLPSALWMACIALIVKPLIYYEFGLYRRLWIYASVQEMKLIVSAVSTATILLSVLMISLFSLGLFKGFPRSVLAIDLLASIIAVGGLRFTFRLLAENKNSTHLSNIITTARRVLVVGAGDAGVLVVREMQKNPQLN